MTKTRMILYWATTGMLVLALASSGVTGLAQHPEHVKVLAHLGYSAYFGVILGFWKVLGATALIVPGRPQLKEWAYAGIFFNMTGAAVSHVACGDSIVQVAKPKSVDTRSESIFGCLR